jgi:hypothetical protein
MINRLAGAALPSDVPEFLGSPQGLNALEYDGPEPDRWRERTEPELNTALAPEHLMDMEYLDVRVGSAAPPLRLRAHAGIRAEEPSRSSAVS